jgi:hypothetical protein
MFFSKIALFFSISFLFFCSCVNIPYEDDKGFLNSAQANSFEFLVYANGKVCKDMDDQVGLCSKRIKNNDNLEFKIDPLEYAYRLNVTCTKELNANFTRDYPEKTTIKFSITPAQYQSVKTFVCIGEIFPTDRPDEISFKWQIRVEITDQKYLGREQIFIQKKGKQSYLVLGQNARLSKVSYNGKIHSYKNDAIVHIPEDAKDLKASSESYMGRFNYFGY